MAAFIWLVCLFLSLVSGQRMTDANLATPATTKISDWCKDNSTLNCWYYPDEKCVGAYEGWARVYCPYRCGYCPNFYPPCEDLDSNCAAFRNGSCTDTRYRAYMREHCRRYCNECHYPGQNLLPISPPPPTDINTAASTVNTVHAKEASEWCKDNSTLNCWYYPDEKCVGAYEGWARAYCPYRCGYCPNFYPPCEDLDSNCAVFVNGSCSNVLYRAYMREHCRRHCNECYYPGHDLTPNFPPDHVLVITTTSNVNTPVMAGPGSPTILERTTGDATSLTTHQAMSTTPGLMCPECDTHFNCVWNRVCYPGEVCMLRQYPNYPFSVHCSKKADCIFMKMNLKGADILCCEEHTCITDIIP